MKLLLVLMVCALAAAAPEIHKVESLQLAEFQNGLDNRSFLINSLIRRLIAYIRYIINWGSDIFGIPPLDPLNLDHFHLVIPAGIINLDLGLKGVHVSGIGSFEVHKSDLNLSTMTFDIDISVPVLDISADEYDLIGDLFTAVPLYGKGRARFVVEGFRFKAKLLLKQSDNKKSIIIEKVIEPSFDLPSLKSELTGTIGGGNIDGIVNAMIEEVIFDYINRFRGAIALLSAPVALSGLNPILAQLDTWKYIAPLMPRS